MESREIFFKHINFKFKFFRSHKFQIQIFSTREISNFNFYFIYTIYNYNNNNAYNYNYNNAYNYNYYNIK